MHVVIGLAILVYAIWHYRLWRLKRRSHALLYPDRSLYRPLNPVQPEAGIAMGRDAIVRSNAAPFSRN